MYTIKPQYRIAARGRQGTCFAIGIGGAMLLAASASSA